MKKTIYLMTLVVVLLLTSITFDAKAAGLVPTYRFWSNQNQVHFYTSSESEKDYVIATWPDAWRYEGIAYYNFSGPASIDSADIKDGAVSTDDIEDGSVTTGKMSSNNCSSGEILKYNGSAWACATDNDSGAGALPDDSVTSANIIDGVIVNADIASGAAIDSDKIDYLGKTINVGVTGQNNFGDDARIDYNSIDDELRFSNSAGGFEFSGGTFKHTSSGAFYFNYISDVSYGASVQDIGSSVLEVKGPPLENNGNITLSVDSFLKLNPVSSAPTSCDSGQEGVVYYNSTDHKIKVCNGTTWSDMN